MRSSRALAAVSRRRSRPGVEAGPPQAGAAVAVVAEDAVRCQAPALPLGMGAQAVELLVSGLRLRLALGRYPGVDGYLHGGSPPVRPPECRSLGRLKPRRAL